MFVHVSHHSHFPRTLPVIYRLISVEVDRWCMLRVEVDSEDLSEMQFFWKTYPIEHPICRHLTLNSVAHWRCPQPRLKSQTEMLSAHIPSWLAQSQIAVLRWRCHPYSSTVPYRYEPTVLPIYIVRLTVSPRKPLFFVDHPQGNASATLYSPVSKSPKFPPLHHFVLELAGWTVPRRL